MVFTRIAVAAGSPVEFLAENAGHVVGGSEAGLFCDVRNGQFCGSK